MWTQLLLVVGICLDRAIHISRPLTYHLKPYMLVLYLAVPVAIPFLTLTTPYILAAQASIESALAKEHDRESVFICSYAAVMNETTGEKIRSRHIFMGNCLVFSTLSHYYTARSSSSRVCSLLCRKFFGRTSASDQNFQ